MTVAVVVSPVLSVTCTVRMKGVPAPVGNAVLSATVSCPVVSRAKVPSLIAGNQGKGQAVSRISIRRRQRANERAHPTVCLNAESMVSHAGRLGRVGNRNLEGLARRAAIAVGNRDLDLIDIVAVGIGGIFKVRDGGEGQRSRSSCRARTGRRRPRR